MSRSVRVLAEVVLVSALLLVGKEVDAAPDSAPDAVEQALAALERSAPARRLARTSIREARAAQQRAQDARGAGDRLHANMLDALAREWVETAQALVRADEVEQRLAVVQKRLSDIETKSIRAKALLEETAARRGRAQKKLQDLDQASRADAAAGEQP